MKTRLILMFLAFLLLHAPLFAGVVFEIEVTDHGQSPPKSESIQAAVEGRNLKMGVASKGRGKQGTMIYRGDLREVVIVDHEKRTYTVIDKEVIGRIAGQMSEAKRMMQDALKNVPEDKRAMIEQMMKTKMPNAPAQAPQGPKSELKKTSERGDKNGYPCVKYELLRDGRKVRELWVTDWSNVEGGSEVVDVFEDMADLFREMKDAIAKIGGGRGGSGIDNNVFEHMKELGGFPVVTRDFGADGSLEGETGLRSAKSQTIDPDAFEPPSGYKRQEMFRPVDGSPTGSPN